MNKRIGELYRKASFDDNVASEQEMVEKFAELIIKECAKIADDGFGSAHFGLGISGRMLKDHFGIED